MDGLTEAERRSLSGFIAAQHKPGLVAAVEAILRDRLADLQESNVALLQRVADLTTERDDARASRDETRELWSAIIPGHRWERVGRMCECGAEVGLRGDRQTVEAHLAEAAERALASRDEAIARVRAIHKPIRVYDECEHDDCPHPPIEVYDYIACKDSQIGWGCDACCYDGDLPREDCPHGADHCDVPREQSCPTHAALAALPVPAPVEGATELDRNSAPQPDEDDDCICELLAPAVVDLVDCPVHPTPPTTDAEGQEARDGS